MTERLFCLCNLIAAKFQPSDIHSIPSDELSSVVISVVPVLSCVITFWVCFLLGGVVAFITQDGWVAACRGGKALGSCGVGGGGWVCAWAAWRGSRVGWPKQRSALRIPLCSFFLPTSSIFLLGLRLRVLWVVPSDALFAHRTCLLGLCEPRVYTLAVVGWKARKFSWKTWQRTMNGAVFDSIKSRVGANTNSTH